MGFDLYGIEPKENMKEPAILKKNIFKMRSDKQKEKYWNARDLYNEKNPGIYFRNNVWWWRPLWDYVCEVCYQVMTDEDVQAGQYNDGVDISKETSIKMYKILETLLDAGEVKKKEEAYKK